MAYLSTTCALMKPYLQVLPRQSSCVQTYAPSNGIQLRSTLVRKGFSITQFSACSKFNVGTGDIRGIPSLVSSASNTPRRGVEAEGGKGLDAAAAFFASLSSSSQPAPPPQPPISSSSSPGSPLLWIGVGVALCVAVNKAAGWMKARVMRLAMEAMMKQMGAPSTGSSSGSPFPFPPSPAATSPFGQQQQQKPFSSPSPAQQTKGSSSSSSSLAGSAPIDTTLNEKPSSTFTDVGTSTAKGPSASSSTSAVDSQSSSTPPSAPGDSGEPKPETAKPKKRFFQDAEVVEESSDAWTGWSGYNSSASSSSASSSSASSSSAFNGGSASGGAGFGVETIEKMLENPQMQDMILQYMPEEMRSPETLKWMLQNPMMRQQLEQHMATLTQGGLGDDMGDLLKKYDLNDPEIKKQYDEMGFSPEQAVKAVMDNPELAMAFQNPKIQAALLDCAKDPRNQLKYIYDKEIMDVFEKISTLFPGASG